MAKIFIDIDILPKAYRKLDICLKQAWFYIWTHCDKSGVWEVDHDLFEFENGFELQEEKFAEVFKDLVEIQNGKLLMKDFIKINYGTLTENYNPHKPVFRDMAKNNIKLTPNLHQAFFKLVDVYEEEDKGEDETGKGSMREKPKSKTKKSPEPKTEPVYPFDTENFKAQWQLWKAYKQKEFKFHYASVQSEQASLSQLANLSATDEVFDEQKAIAIIHQSFANGWKGFFPLKNLENGTGKQATGKSKVNYSDDFKRKIAERLQPR